MNMIDGGGSSGMSGVIWHTNVALRRSGFLKMRFCYVRLLWHEGI